MQKWEYKALKFHTTGWSHGIMPIEEFEKTLNDMGEQGWELVSVYDTNYGQGGTREVIAVLKRPRL